MYYVKLSLYYVLSCARLLLLVVAAGLAYVFKHLHLASITVRASSSLLRFASTSVPSPLCTLYVYLI